MQLNKAKMWWVNNNHMPADALTKFSTDARQDLLLRFVQLQTYRITYCELSGRRETQEKNKSAKSKPKTFHIGSDDEEEMFYVGDFGESDDEEI